MELDRAAGRPGRLAPLLALAVTIASACGGASPAGVTPPEPTPPPKRPNLVFILADDLDVRTAAMMPRLPALIGQHGLTFERSYVAQSLCAPSRASILTGQYPHDHRVLD